MSMFAQDHSELYINPEAPDPTEGGGGLLEVATHLGVRLLQEGPTPGTAALDVRALWQVRGRALRCRLGACAS